MEDFTEKKARKFKVGDRVYAPFHGYGVVTKIHEDKCVYPIIVTWDDTNVPFMEDVSSFTEDGCLLQYFDNDSTVLKVVDKESTKKEKKSMAEDKKFKVGDHVWSPHFGAGIVTETEADSGAEYPIKVEWGHSGELCPYDYFTKDGQSDISGCNPDMAIYSVEPEHAAKVIPNLSNELTKKPEEDEGIVEQMEDALNKKTEDALTLVEKALPKKDETEEGETMKDNTTFEVGDNVWSYHFGVGIVTRVSTGNMPYPVAVKWTDDARSPNTSDYFTKDGKFDYSGDVTKDIIPLEVIGSSEEEGIANRMIEVLAKKDDAINPSHYRVKGIPEAIHLMTQLMTKEQLEGFLWGNIIKYSYRYGRKGDKKETAGKIAWYATHLKELEEEKRK